MSVNFEYYKIFYYIAKYKSITKAANVLLKSQPNVTRDLKKLENELSLKLFVRSSKGMTLTYEGERLYKYVSVACEQLFTAENEMLEGTSLTGGTLTIGSGEMALHCFLLEKLNVFGKAYPSVKLKVKNTSTPEALKALKNGQIDLAVITSPIHTYPSFRITKLKTVNDILIGGMQAKELMGKPVSLAEISHYPLISVSQGTTTYEFYNRFYFNHGLPFIPETEVATMDLLLPFVKNGLGLGFVPEIFAVSAIENGEVFKIDLKEEIPLRNICLICDKNRVLGAAAKELIKILKEKETI